MAVRFKAVKRRNPSDPGAAQKYYATTIASGSIDFKKLAKLIAGQCTARVADCQAVLAALEENIIACLQDGNIVQLDGIGTLRLSVSAEGQPTEEVVSHQNVKKARILFRPGSGLSETLKNLKYQKAS